MNYNSQNWNFSKKTLWKSKKKKEIKNFQKKKKNQKFSKIKKRNQKFSKKKKSKTLKNKNKRNQKATKPPKKLILIILTVHKCNVCIKITSSFNFYSLVKTLAIDW